MHSIELLGNFLLGFENFVEALARRAVPLNTVLLGNFLLGFENFVEAPRLRAARCRSIRFSWSS